MAQARKRGGRQGYGGPSCQEILKVLYQRFVRARPPSFSTRMPEPCEGECKGGGRGGLAWLDQNPPSRTSTRKLSTRPLPTEVAVSRQSSRDPEGSTPLRSLALSVGTTQSGSL